MTTSLAGYTVVFGGSFNPPHMGHMMACTYLTEGLGADGCWLIPCFEHPFDKELLAYETRLQMCELMASSLGARVSVSRVEEQLGGVSRTYDTLCHLQKSDPDRRFALAVGADICEETQRWHRWADIEQMVKVVVIGRTGFSGPQSAGLALPEVSSTEIRHRLAKGESPVGLVPERVLAFIESERLFR